MSSDSRPSRAAVIIAFLRRHPWLTVGLVAMFLGGALFVGVEWNAEWRWQRYAAEARARGVKLHRADVVAPDVPDEQNFAAIPMLKESCTDKKYVSPFLLPTRPERPKPADGSEPPYFDPGPPRFEEGTKPNFENWQQYFVEVGFLKEPSGDPARDTLRALEHFAPQIDQWRQGREARPQFRLLVDATKVDRLEFPYYPFYCAVEMFRLRMYAHLATGDSAGAYEDFQDGMHAPRAWMTTKDSFSDIGAAQWIRFFLEALGDGLQEHAWADPELKKFEADLQTFSLWERYCAELEYSRLLLNEDFEESMNLPIRKRIERTWDDSRKSRTQRALQILTRSVYRDNQLRMNRFIDELTVRNRASGQFFDPDRQTPSSPDNVTTAFERRYYALSGKAYDYSSVEADFIHRQIWLDQTRVACALERFWLVNGVYPDTLRDLIPAWIDALPVDPHSHASYCYQKIGGGSFLLYSMGSKEDREADPPSSEDQPPSATKWESAPTAEP